MLQLSEGLDHYVSEFERFTGRSNGEPAWLRRIRQDGFSQFMESGFPTTSQEDWRFTSVAPIAKIPFRQPELSSKVELPQQLLIPGAHRIVFINGFFALELSDWSGLSQTVVLQSVALAAREGNAGVKEHLGRLADSQQNSFVSLNNAFLKDGTFLFVPQGTVVEHPVQILYITSSVPDIAVFPRNLVVLGKQSKVSIFESYYSLQTGRYLTNAVNEIRMEEGSILEHCILQNESNDSYSVVSTQVHQARDTRYSSYFVSIGASLSRNNLNVALDGEGAHCALNGVYLASGRQHMDHHTSIDHIKPHATSQELYKGILDGMSRAVFNGRIIVRKEAQQTNARQTNRNLLMSQGSQVNTKPELQILADDVKCSHGATIGQLDPEAVFYFQSRGIDPKIAASLLTFGFAMEPVASIQSEEMGVTIRNTVAQHLHMEAQ